MWIHRRSSVVSGVPPNNECLDSCGQVKSAWSLGRFLSRYYECVVRARHAAFDLSLSYREEPSALRWCPISLMTDEEREAYDASHVTQLLVEVGNPRNAAYVLGM